jgi:ATP-dependent helicase HrpB
MQRIRLPIDDILPDALAVLERERCLVLQASPGSGKTTRLPPALLKAAFTGGKKEVLVLEPRRLAAKLAATRVAFELGENVGETVGYQFRFERVGGPKTRLRFFTEGMLLRRLLSDPRLDNVAAVVLDEFHERHLQGDIALAYLRQLQSGVRPDLRLVVMSATLDTATVAHFLGDCRTLKVEAPIHPIDVQHAPGPLAVRLE